SGRPWNGGSRGVAPMSTMMNAFNVIHDLGTWAKAHSAEVMVGTIVIPTLMAMGTYLMRTNQPLGSTVHGSARWAYDHEVRRAGFYGRHGAWSSAASRGGGCWVMARGMSSWGDRRGAKKAWG